MNGTAELPVTFNDDGETEQVAAVGTPLHDRLTDPLNPEAGESCKLYVAVWPAVIVDEVDPPLAAPSDKSVPEPLRETVCGLPAAVSEMLRVAIRAPVADGVNVTLTWQFDPAATVVPQVFVSAKSLLFAPPIEIPLMLNAPVPVFLTLIVWAVELEPAS